MRKVTPFGFRLLILLSAITALTSSLLIPVLSLPPALSHTELLFPQMAIVFNFIVGFNFLLGLAATVGLFMFWHWSRAAAIISYFLTFLSYSMSAYFTDAGIKVALDSSSMFLGGVVLSMAYYSEIAERFR